MSTTSSTTSTVTTDRSSALDQPIGLPPAGHVSRLRTNWSVYEDGALAQKLQTEEISTHLQFNKQKNHQIRDDFPKALEEQTKEQHQVERWVEERRRQLREQERIDAELARQVALEMGSGKQQQQVQQQQQQHRSYEEERDRIFAERLQQRSAAAVATNQPRQRLPIVPQPRGIIGLESPTSRQDASQSSPSTTPPLPVMSNGDVPYHKNGNGSSKSRNVVDDDVLPHVRAGLRYNDEQYLVKLARPAVVTAEPVYANNRPEHYAVSAQFAMSETGAIAKTPRPLGTAPPDTPKATELLLGATGLSQRDLALSRRAEEQLEQERRDQELARRLQAELNFDQTVPETDEARLYREERDRRYAEMLQAKEEAKLQRAKERAKLKKMQRKQHEQQLQQLDDYDDRPHEPHQKPIEIELNYHHERAHSQPTSMGGGAVHSGPASGGLRADSRLSRRSEGGRHSRTSANSRSFEEDVRPPARRPYMNPGAIDAHRSEFAVHPSDDADDDEDEEDGDEEVTDNDMEREVEEPQYANVGPAAALAVREELAREHARLSYLHHGDSPIPPYMPLQQPVSRKSTSLEKRIKKKKEKEGCKQQ